MGDDFDVQEITNELGIVPTKTWNKGENIRKTERRYSFTNWEYRIGPLYTLSTDAAMERLERLFSKKANKLCELKRKYNLNIGIEVVVYIRQNEPPGIVFEPRFIKFVNQIGATIDIDLYVD